MKNLPILLLVLFLSVSCKEIEATPFVTEWNIPRNDHQIRFEESENYYDEDYDITIDWGDGTKDNNIYQHTYKKKGIYLIKITGKYPGIIIGGKNYYRYKPELITVKSWGNHEWITMEDMFRRCINFEKIEATDQPNISKTVNMAYMFAEARNFNHDIGHWEVSNVENMSGMFAETEKFNQNIGGWDVSNVKNMSEMFAWSKKFEGKGLEKWDVSHVVDMSNMFREASFFPNIEKWDVSKVKNMSEMFAKTDFNKNIGHWNLSNATNMRSMFKGATAFNQDIGDWDVSKVTDMYGVFEGATSFDRDISRWDVSNVTNMNWMFQNATSFNKNISSWDVSKVQYMNGLFYHATSFDQDISQWDVSNVKDMYQMFEGAKNFDQSLGDWKLSSIREGGLESMLDDTNLSIKNYEATLKGWAKNAKTTKKRVLGAKGLQYKKSKHRADLIKQKGWTIVGDKI